MSPSSLLVLLAVAAPLAAQQPDSASLAPQDSAISRHFNGDHRGNGRWARRSHRRMATRRGMAFDPAHLLARKDALGLSAQQVAQLTALERSAKPAMTTALQQIRIERAAIATGLSADAPDTVQLKRHYVALQTAAGNARWARLSTALQARAVLTDAQRGKVRGWADSRGRRWYSKGHRYRL